MSEITVDKDLEAARLTVTATYDAPVERVWQMWANPRQLERWWGPPGYPATVVDHELNPGGRVSYYMTSPEGVKHHGWWEVQSVDPPHGLVFVDGFADDAGQPVDDMPISRSEVTLEAVDGGTRMITVSSYDSRAELERVLEMGMAEGITAALGQIDALLVES